MLRLETKWVVCRAEAEVAQCDLYRRLGYQLDVQAFDSRQLTEGVSLDGEGAPRL